ncbi:hypothetical protein BRD00_08915 [Halobacteriales archaeon QS_8_69_26]|nr:MAG: hypothetical protein BRD00_08915 [Halobacteriales archaeon QS_8_69_26]
MAEPDDTENGPESREPLHTGTIEEGYVYVPRQIIKELDLEDDGLVRWYLTDDGEVSIEFDHQPSGVFDGDEMTAPMGNDGQEAHDLAGAERSEDIEERDFSAGFGRWKDKDTDHLYRECPICGSEVYRGKVGGHLDKHWDEIVELVQKSE